MEGRVEALRAREPEVFVPMCAGLPEALAGAVVLPQLERERPLTADAARQVGPGRRIEGAGADQFGAVDFRLPISLDRLGHRSRDLDQGGHGQRATGQVATVRGVAAEWPWDRPEALEHQIAERLAIAAGVDLGAELPVVEAAQPLVDEGDEGLQVIARPGRAPVRRAAGGCGPRPGPPRPSAGRTRPVATARSRPRTRRPRRSPARPRARTGPAFAGTSGAGEPGGPPAEPARARRPGSDGGPPRTPPRRHQRPAGSLAIAFRQTVSRSSGIDSSSSRGRRGSSSWILKSSIRAVPWNGRLPVSSS